jgi:hypothetical protein
MDSGSFSQEYAWNGTAPSVNFEAAGNSASYEWTIGNLTWHQYDSCSQARGGDNAVVCHGMRNWCKWMGTWGVPGLVTVLGQARSQLRAGCDLPAEWACVRETAVRLNGYAWWRDAGCGLGSVSVGSPTNPEPDDPSDPRLKHSCQRRNLPVLATQANATHLTVHEFGHGVRLVDTGKSCVPVATVMEQSKTCEMLVPCPSRFTTTNDVASVRYLYGP